MKSKAEAKLKWPSAQKFYKYFSSLISLVLIGGLPAEDLRIPEANYELAAKFAPEQFKKMIFDVSVQPRWLKGSDRFWYPMGHQS